MAVAPTQTPEATTTAPTTSPETAPAADPYEGAEVDDVDISMFDAATIDQPGAAEIASTQPPATAQTPQQPVQPQSPAAPVDPAATTPAAPAQPQAPQAPAEPVDPVAAYEAWRGGAIDTLAKGYYTLDQQMTARIKETAMEDPGAAFELLMAEVPRLMSRIYLDAVTASTNIIAQALPQAVIGTIEDRKQAEKNVEDFYAVWPGLKAHHDRVGQIGMDYRRMNPTATRERFIQDVGAMAALALNLGEQARGAPQQPQAQQPNGAGRAPFVPPGAAARPVAPFTEPNIFTQMYEEGDN